VETSSGPKEGKARAIWRGRCNSWPWLRVTLPLPHLPHVPLPPSNRPRRRRRTAAIRQLVREHELSPSDLIQPLFVVHGSRVEREIGSMPGVFHLSVDEKLDREVDHIRSLGIPAVVLFGIPATKDEVGSENFAEDGIVQRALRRLRERDHDLLLITDLCCCEYTSHGHCGVVRDGTVDNDATLEILGRTAVSHARAGADIVAPSGMMDGMVAAIRSALDGAGYTETSILSYAVKYASAFYGPFREAADSAPAFGDRRQYQMDPANVREALLEAALDEAEGADLLMVKPALAYLDVVRAVRERTQLPLVAYNVSGEYAMVKAAARLGWIDECRVVLEALTGMRRAGADAIISYHAKDAAVWLSSQPLS
jgi:porphobilinogen synthase